MLSSASQRVSALLGAAVLLIVGCDDSPTPTERSPLATSEIAESPTDAEQQTISRLAKLVAIAVQDEGLRQRIKTDMRKAPVLEHKLSLSSYVKGQSGGILLAKVAQQSDASKQEFLDLLDEVPPLEFYMPVDDHRLTWTGTTDVIVAGHLDEGDPVWAYSVGGDRKPLSEESVPNNPVLILTSAENDFSTRIDDGAYVNRDHANGNAIGVYERTSVSVSQDCLKECDFDYGGGYSPDWDVMSSGVWLTDQYLTELGESWTKGDPELEIHTARNDPTDEIDDEGDIIRCVAESRTGEASYVQNDNHYNNDEVLLATKDQVDSAEPNGLMFIVYEDDDTTCDIRDETDALENSISAVKAFKSGLDAITGDKCDDDDSLCKILEVAESAIQVITSGANVVKSNDDLIGEIVEANCQVDGNSGDYQVRRETGVNGCATLKGN